MFWPPGRPWGGRKRDGAGEGTERELLVCCSAAVHQLSSFAPMLEPFPRHPRHRTQVQGNSPVGTPRLRAKPSWGRCLLCVFVSCILFQVAFVLLSPCVAFLPLPG